VTAPADEARVAISDTILRYATAIDRRDWDLLATCFTDDCVSDYGDIGAWTSRDGIVEYMEAVHAACGHSLHRITNVVIDLGDGGAAARSYVDAVVLAEDNASGVNVLGMYDDVLVASTDGWRIARRRFTMVRLAPLDADPSS
jgi:3-phenylpropionate/cinnamic acid dioxygenase small subunit